MKREMVSELTPEESNCSLNRDVFKEQFVYPKNAALKESYIALLGMMKIQKKIRFYVHDSVCSILEQNGWISDYNPGSPTSKPDKNYKKALRFLKVLENPYFIFAGPGRIELCVYDASTKRRITNFDRFFQMCAEDPYMSEYTSCDEEVIFEPWDDAISCATLSDNELASIATEVQMLDAAVPLKTDTIKSTFKTDFDKQTFDKQKYFEQLSDELTHSECIEV
ncbi:hypothetical protein [Methanolobus sp.]|uniref:hypothetical protein n=1 Tax=Methanolobus sp. TaxID=1874737 RepID=UPI0025F3580B|nr:hypothetical protein [Methanolobus sp.]